MTYNHCLQKITDARPLVTNPNGTRTFKQCKVGYVDDNKLLVELHQPDFSEIIGLEHLTHCIDTWSRLTDHSGGKITLGNKTYLQILS